MSARPSRALGALTVSLFLALAACGGGGVKLDDLGDEFVEAACERQVRCGAYASMEACRNDVRAFLDNILASVEAGRINYDEGKARDCLDAFAGASCDRSAENAREEPAACGDTFTGTVPDGGTCYIGLDCVSGSCDVADCGQACCSGTCAATLAEVAIGGTCNNTTGPCVRGSFCDAQTTTCVALRAIGGACTSSSQCTYGAYCGEAGTCADAPNRGDACPDGVCADLGDRCSSTTTTCVALGRLGEACSEGFAGLFDCQAPLVCDQTSLQCANPPTAGQACLFFCAAGNFCNDQDVCEAQKANGAACDSDSECTSRYCDDTTSVCAEQPVCG